MMICDLDPVALSELPDSILLHQAAAGDEQAFETFVSRYQSSLSSFIHRCVQDDELTYDVLQFVFLQLYLSLSKLQHNLHSTRTNLPLKSWLFQVARNRCVDELRKRRFIFFSELEATDLNDDSSFICTIPDVQPLPEDTAEADELRLVMHRAIDKLPPRLRSVVFLRYTREMTFVEIGHVLDMPENTAKAYFQRARPLLRAELASHLSAVL